MPVDEQRAAIRRTLSWVLVGALCVAALTAIVAVVSGDFDDDDARVIGTSIGLAVFSATGATGATLRLRQSENLRTLGLATIGVSAVAFLLLLTALWVDDADSDALWEWWGAVSLATFACSHAALVTGAFRPDDGAAVRALGVSSVALATTDSGIGILAIAGAFDDVDVDAGAGQALAVLVILLVLTTILTPIVRRIQRSEPAAPGPAARREPAAGAAPAAGAVAAGAAPAGAAPAGAAPAGAAPAGAAPEGTAPATLAAEVIATADRIEALNADPGNRAPEIRREVQRLRELARLHSR